jgi:hypothetical protein
MAAKGKKGKKKSATTLWVKPPLGHTLFTGATCTMPQGDKSKNKKKGDKGSKGKKGGKKGEDENSKVVRAHDLAIVVANAAAANITQGTNIKIDHEVLRVDQVSMYALISEYVCMYVCMYV